MQLMKVLVSADIAPDQAVQLNGLPNPSWCLHISIAIYELHLAPRTKQ